SLAARRLKRSSLEDVAGMIHSLQNAASQALERVLSIGPAKPDSEPVLRQAADFWYLWSSSAFLRAYAALIADTRLLPHARGQLDLLLHVHLLEEAVYQVQYDLNSVPERARVPLHRIVQLTPV